MHLCCMLWCQMLVVLFDNFFTNPTYLVFVSKPHTFAPSPSVHHQIVSFSLQGHNCITCKNNGRSNTFCCFQSFLCLYISTHNLSFHLFHMQECPYFSNQKLKQWICKSVIMFTKGNYGSAFEVIVCCLGVLHEGWQQWKWSKKCKTHFQWRSFGSYNSSYLNEKQPHLQAGG